jgi:metal-responsive CopG/Arc/MetJ family transcriptional regulator
MSHKRVVRSFSLPPDLVAELNRYADFNMLSASDMVAQAIRAALDGAIEIVPNTRAKPLKPKAP